MEELAFRNTGGVALLSRRGAAEAERAAHCLKRAALRLEVIELRIEKITAEAERVFSFQPREIRRSDILVMRNENGLPVLSLPMLVQPPLI